MTEEIRDLRAAAVRAQPGLIPCGVARSQPFPSTLRAKKVEKDGQSFVQVEGYASVTERGYDMWDMFGPYTEIVAAGAFDKTLDANPDVAFLLNHRGMTMARTTNGSLELSVDDTGLKSVAFLNPKRQDVKDLVIAIEDGNITEMSFAFMITRGQWSPDYMEFRIQEVDLDRGDTSAVNYGANPYTSIAARSHEIIDCLDKLPAGAARAALDKLNGRRDLRPAETSAPAPQASAPAKREEPKGRSLALIRTQLLADDE